MGIKTDFSRITQNSAFDFVTHRVLQNWGVSYILNYAYTRKSFSCPKIDLVTVFDAILTSRQTREKLQCLYENLMSNNFRKTAVLNKISIVN